MHHFLCFIAQLVKMLLQRSLNGVIENRLSFVLNTKWPLRDIWLLRYMQNSFRNFWKNADFQLYKKNNEIVYLIYQQPNIPQRPFCIQRQSQ